ncbi:hypothetical protein [uncultured Pseudodesulfovibrio sp.]|uniref:hypothetical protein n=1 Tax=uncultured Pseudodesulfovibrio sp. TaxID=2035858 RepID=UPI0029C71A1C|nr:hypothetical protein [uncultured Pseudodesulfovibrio sp.]
MIGNENVTVDMEREIESVNSVGKTAMVALTPLQAIRAKCVDCSGWSTKEVRKCELEDCPLHDFRMGKNPHRKKRVLTEAQRKELASRLPQFRQ